MTDDKVDESVIILRDIYYSCTINFNIGCILYLYVISGTQLNELKTKSAVRSNGYSYSGHMIFYTTDRAMGQPCELLVYDTRDEYQISKCQNAGSVSVESSLRFVFVDFHSWQHCLSEVKILKT